MWNGIETLGKIDEVLTAVRRDAVRLDGELAEVSNRIAGAERQRLAVIQEIAKVRLQELEAGELDVSLSAADSRAMTLLEQRQKAFTKLNRDIDAASTLIEATEAKRQLQLQEVDKHSQTVADLEQDVQEQLRQDSVYLLQVQSCAHADSVATESAAKVERANNTMAERAVPYKTDPLFMYLWNRGFGTTKYAGKLFVRWIDSWLARLINYEPARVNYWNLTEIPRRLKLHAERVAQQADDELDQLRALEKDRRERAGVMAAEASLESVRQIADTIDDELEAQENSLNKLLERRAAFMGGDDEYIRQCLSTLTQALDHRNLDAIHRYVLETASPTDDQLVLQISDLDQRLLTKKSDLADLRRVHQHQIGRLKEIETVRRNFKNSRFDDIRSGFNNREIILATLSQFVQGSVTGTELWRVIQKNQRHRKINSTPDFGSDGLGDIFGNGGTYRRGRRRAGSSWHWPKPRPGGGGFRFPSSGGGLGGSRGGGGFKTGGSF